MYNAMLNYCTILLILLFEMMFMTSMSIFLYRYLVFKNNNLKIIVCFLLSFIMQLCAYLYDIHYYYYILCVLFITEHQNNNTVNYIFRSLEKICMIVLYYNII